MTFAGHSRGSCFILELGDTLFIYSALPLSWQQRMLAPEEQKPTLSIKDPVLHHVYSASYISKSIERLSEFQW